ncbi:protein kinase [Cryptosporidium canis]|uniref:Protein kinase n=1 Tax=Cryptosporidium canis TaxID=195482 RepID=A0ABQ8P2S1_9CRYT|nr:protein kinase [Cryptosporidium canis]
MREEYNYDSYMYRQGGGGDLEVRYEQMGGVEGSRKENEQSRREAAMKSKGIPKLELGSMDPKGKWKQITSATFYGDSGPLLSKLYSVPDELQRYFEIYDGVEGVLGRGAYSSVFKIRSKRSGNVYALKVMSTEHFTCRGLGGQLRREIQLQSQCFHPNIVQLYKCLEHNGYVFLILEYVDTNLFSILHRKKKNRVIRVGARRNRYNPMEEDSECREDWVLFSKSEVVSYLTQVLKAVNYLHEMNIVHRDVKPENILVSYDGRVKLGDFGWSGDLCRRCTSMAGTFCYMAPEILRGERQTSKVDSWSIGILLYELYMGNVPFVPKNPSEDGAGSSSQVISMLDSIREISKEARPSHFPPDAWHLCCWLLRKNSSERASPIQALNHPMLADSNMVPTIPVTPFKRPEIKLDSTPRSTKHDVSPPNGHGSQTFTTLPLVAVPTPRKALERERERTKPDSQVKRMVTEIPANMYLYTKGFDRGSGVYNNCYVPQGMMGPAVGTRVQTKATSTLSEYNLQQNPPSESRFYRHHGHKPSQARLEDPPRRDMSEFRHPLPRDNFPAGYLQKITPQCYPLEQNIKSSYSVNHPAALNPTMLDRAQLHPAVTPSREIYVPPLTQIGGARGGFVQDHSSKTVFKGQNPPTRYVSQPPIYCYQQQQPAQVRRNHYLSQNQF